MLAALRRAEQTGVGGRVEVSLAEACGALLSNQALNHLIGGATPQAMGNAHPNVAPYQVLQAADRGIAIAAASDLQFERLCVVMTHLALRRTAVRHERAARRAPRSAGPDSSGGSRAVRRPTGSSR